MATRPNFRRRLRITCAVVALAFGLLQLATALLGSEPISLGLTGGKYYQLVPRPSPLFWLWAALGVAVAAILFALPLLRGRAK